MPPRSCPKQSLQTQENHRLKGNHHEHLSLRRSSEQEDLVGQEGPEGPEDEFL